jgi:hypothetical protein
MLFTRLTTNPNNNESDGFVLTFSFVTIGHVDY